MRTAHLPLAALAALAVAACGGDDSAGTATPKARPATTPFPPSTFSPLKPGATYTTRKFKPSVTFTVPDGEWVATGDSPDHVELEPTAHDPVDDAVLGFHHMKRVFDPKTGGKIPGDAVPGPEDFAQWLTHHPHLMATKPKPVEALGLTGVSIDVRVSSSQPRKYKDCGKVLGDCVVMFESVVEPVVYGSYVLGRFYVLDEPGGGQLVVEQGVEPARAFKAQQPAFDAILRSAKVAG